MLSTYGDMIHGKKDTKRSWPRALSLSSRAHTVLVAVTRGQHQADEGDCLEGPSKIHLWKQGRLIATWNWVSVVMILIILTYEVLWTLLVVKCHIGVKENYFLSLTLWPWCVLFVSWTSPKTMELQGWSMWSPFLFPPPAYLCEERGMCFPSHCTYCCAILLGTTVRLFSSCGSRRRKSCPLLLTLFSSRSSLSLLLAFLVVFLPAPYLVYLLWSLVQLLQNCKASLQSGVRCTAPKLKCQYYNYF